MTPSSSGCVRPASISPAAPWPNTERPCASRPRSNAGGTSSPPPDEPGQSIALKLRWGVPSCLDWGLARRGVWFGTTTGGQSMPFRVSGKHIELGEALRERISARVLEALEKYFDGGFSGHATVGKEAFGFQTECVVHLDSGIMLRADSMAADAYLSADQAAEKLEKRLRRYHRRLKDYKGNGRNNGHVVDDAGGIAVPDYVIAAPEHEDNEEVTGFNP